MYGVRYRHELGERTSFLVDLGWLDREANKRLFLPLSNKTVLLSTTSMRCKSFGVGFGLAMNLAQYETWDAGVVLGGVVPSAYRVAMDVTTPSGVGERFRSDGDGQVGSAIRFGGRYSRVIWNGARVFFEATGFAVIRDVYAWLKHNGLALQPSTPRRGNGLSLILGLEFGPRRSLHDIPSP